MAATVHSEQMGKGSAVFDSLMRVSYLAGQSLDLNEVLPSTLAGIADLLPADRVTLLQDEGNRIIVHSAWSQPQAKSVLQWDSAYSKREQPHLCVDAMQHCSSLESDGEAIKRHLPYLASSGPLEALLIPLLVDCVSVGRLDVVREDGQSFNDWERRFAEACGKILSLTVRNGLEYARVAWLAEHDSLTGVGNRRQFDLALTRELARAQRYHRDVSLILFDVDDFKQVNVHMGLSAGDDILRRIGAVLVGSARKGVDVSCRIGGDEFAMILPEIGESAANELAQRLQREVLLATAPVWPVRFSYSISTYPHIKPEQFRRHADFRLLDAKDQKNSACPTPNVVQ